MRFVWPVSLILAVGCAAPRIPVAPPISVAPAPKSTVPLDVCVLVHQQYPTSQSNALDGGHGDITMAFATIVVRHPTQGVVLIDPSIGHEKTKDFAENPWPMRRVVGDGSKAIALGELLTRAGLPADSIKLALVTHAHWDHICGATDVPNATIMMRDPDLAWADTAKNIFGHAVPQHEVERIRTRVKTFKAEGAPYEGFPSSFDLFGDGSIVGVPTPGHTPGSTSWFVNLGDGRRFLFIGDAAWTLDGIEQPAHKGWAGRFADNDKEKTGETLAVLHAFSKARPTTTPPDGVGVQIVPAHDPRALQMLPPCAK